MIPKAPAVRKASTNNKAMFTGKALLPILLLLAGLMVATVQIRNRSRVMSKSKIVQMPLIGGSESKREGPWPECVGLAGEECQRIIEAHAVDVRGNVFLVDQDMMVTMDFQTDRVRIFVDADGNVAKTPSRG